MTKSKRTHNVKAASTTKNQRKATHAKKSDQPKSRANSKQADVITMLSRPQGSTIPAIMKVTGWQQHSVRGFFAGVVRNKLSLNLQSVKTDGERVYRIVAGKPAKATSKGKSKLKAEAQDPDRRAA